QCRRCIDDPRPPDLAPGLPIAGLLKFQIYFESNALVEGTHNGAPHFRMVAVVDKLGGPTPVESTQNLVGQEDAPGAGKAGCWLDHVPLRKPIQIEVGNANSCLLISAQIYRRAQYPGATAKVDGYPCKTRRRTVAHTHCG